MGTGSRATAADALALGTTASATGAGAIAIGRGATATGSVAVGIGASASNGGAAFGDNATATGTNATAVGPNATATHANAAAFGTGAATTRANQQVFGTTSNTYTMPGITSGASQAAQTGGPTHIVTSDANGNLAARTPAALGLATSASVTGLNNAVLGLQSSVAGLQADMNKAFRDIDRNAQGIAVVAALSGLTLPTGKDFAVGVDLGFYDDKQAIAAKAAMRLSDNITLTGAVGIGLNDSGRAAGRIGVVAAW